MQLLLVQKGETVLSWCFLSTQEDDCIFYSGRCFHNTQNTPTNTLRAPCHSDDICCHNTRLPNKVQKYPLSATQWAQSLNERRPWGFSSRPQNSLAAGGDIPAASENKQCTRTEESLTQTFGSHLSWSSYPEKPSWFPASGHARKTPGTWTVLYLSPFFLSLSLSLTSIHL